MAKYCTLSLKVLLTCLGSGTFPSFLLKGQAVKVVMFFFEAGSKNGDHLRTINMLKSVRRSLGRLGQSIKEHSDFFPSMPVSLSGITHHSHSFTRLEIYHHIYFIYHTFRHSNPSSMEDVCPMNLV